MNVALVTYMQASNSPLSCLCIKETGWVSEKPAAGWATFRCQSLPCRAAAPLLCPGEWSPSASSSSCQHCRPGPWEGHSGRRDRGGDLWPRL